jgi:hypothetical protein
MPPCSGGCRGRVAVPRRAPGASIRRRQLPPTSTRRNSLRRRRRSIRSVAPALPPLPHMRFPLLAAARLRAPPSCSGSLPSGPGPRADAGLAAGGAARRGAPARAGGRTDGPAGGPAGEPHVRGRHRPPCAGRRRQRRHGGGRLGAGRGCRERRARPGAGPRGRRRGAERRPDARGGARGAHVPRPGWEWHGRHPPRPDPARRGRVLAGDDRRAVGRQPSRRALHVPRGVRLRPRPRAGRRGPPTRGSAG